MYQFNRRKSFYVFICFFLFSVAATHAGADRIAILEKGTTQQGPILSLYDPFDQFAHHSGPGIPDDPIRFENIVDLAGCGINGSGGDALVVLGLNSYGYNTLFVLEKSPDTVPPVFQVTAGTNYLGRNIKFMTAGNFDADADKEIAVVSISSLGRYSLMIYDLPSTIVYALPRASATDPYIGTDIIALSSADMNGDGIDELIIVRNNSDGGFAVEVYDPPKRYLGDIGAPLAGFAGIGKNIIFKGVTAGEFDGDPEPELGLIQKRPDNSFLLEIFDMPRTVGEDAGEPLASAPIIAGDIIALAALNALADDQPANEPPEAVIEASTHQGVAPLGISLTGDQSRDPDGSIVAYQWNFGDGSSAEGSSVEYTFRKAGNYRITLTVTDDQGAQDTGEITVAVLPPEDGNASPQAVIQATPPVGNAPLLVLFSGYQSRDPDGYIRRYDWKLDDRLLTSYRSFYYVFQNPGTYQVTLTVTDDEGAQNTAATTIEVLGAEPSNEPPEAVIDAWPNRGTAPLEVSFDASRSWDREGFVQSFRWELGDGTTAAGQRIQHVYNEPGYYRVVLTVTDNGGAKNSSQLIIEVADDQGSDADLLEEEKEVVVRINQERQKYGLQILTVADELVAAARRHSADMAANNLFSHTGSDGSSPYTRIIEAGYRFRYAGENIAAGYATAQQVVSAWMNSPGHRANILNAGFCEVGIGYIYESGSFYRNYWTLTLACR